MNAPETLTRPHVAGTPFTLVLIGGLALHGELSAGAVMDRAEAMGLDTAATARAVLMLVDERAASVQRDGTGGKLIAAPGLAEMSRARRVRAIIAWLVQARGVGHA